VRMQIENDLFVPMEVLLFESHSASVIPARPPTGR
jgi:hypothetical protein